MTAERVREIRKERGLTQKRLSSIVGFPLRTIQKWEGSERTMSKWSELDFMLKLNAYDKSIEKVSG